MHSKALTFKVLALIWGCIIIWLSLMHLPPHVEDRWWHIPNLDKYVHITMYSILAILIYKGYSRHWLVVLISCTGYGLLMEYFQKWFTTYRSFEWADVLADAIGALVGYGIMRVIEAKSRTGYKV